MFLGRLAVSEWQSVCNRPVTVKVKHVRGRSTLVSHGHAGQSARRMIPASKGCPLIFVNPPLFATDSPGWPGVQHSLWPIHDDECSNTFQCVGVGVCLSWPLEKFCMDEVKCQVNSIEAPALWRLVPGPSQTSKRRICWTFA